MKWFFVGFFLVSLLAATVYFLPDLDVYYGHVEKTCCNKTLCSVLKCPQQLRHFGRRCGFKINSDFVEKEELWNCVLRYQYDHFYVY